MTRIESPFIRCFSLDTSVTILVYHNIAGIVAGIGACMVDITEMVLRFAFERGLEDGRKDTFDDILDILRVLG